MSPFFAVREIKDCRKYWKHIYKLPLVLDETFISHFSFLGKPVITNFQQFVPTAHNLLTIRSDAFAIELSGGLQGKDLFVTFGIKERSLVTFVEEALEAWVTQHPSNILKIANQ